MGRVDVDAMLSEMTPEEFEEWWAVAQLEGWDREGEWRKFGTIAATAHNAGVNIRRNLGEEGLTTKDLREPEDYVPGKELTEREAKPLMTSEEAERRAAQLYGDG